MKKEELISLDVDYAEIVRTDDTLCLVDIDILHTGLNRNNSILTKESVEKSLPTFFNKPIVAIYDCELKSHSIDVKSHAQNEYEETQRVCVGVIPLAEYSNPRWIRSGDGYERLRLSCVIWSFYCEDIVRILQKKKGKSKVSLEIFPVSSEKDMRGNLLVSEFQFLGVSILGDKITEGMVGSKLEVVKFSYDNLLNKTEEYFSVKTENIIEEIKKQKKENRQNMAKTQLVGRELWYLVIKAIQKENKSYLYLENIYSDHLVVKDLRDKKFYEIPSDIDENEKTFRIHWDEMKKMKEQKIYAKEDIGTKATIKVDKDKISDKAWGEANKDLRDKVIEAKNFKSLAKDVFLRLEDGWENGEKTKLDYPVMEIDGETAIYNRHGLSSAKGYAEKNNETEVLEKLKKIYKHLDLKFDDDDDDDNPEIEEPNAGAEKNKTEKDKEDDTATRESETKKEITSSKMKKMSADANVDSSAQQEYLDEEAKVNSKKAKEQNDLVIAEIETFKIRCEAYEKELYELRKYKTDMEEKQKLFKVEEVMAECNDELPLEKKEEFKKLSSDYSIKDIEQWANTVRAEAYQYAKDKKEKIQKFSRMDIWGIHNEPQKSSSLWECGKK